MTVPVNDFKTTMTTMFWVGERADAENAAGLDVSPAVWHRLGMTDNALTEWRFIEESEVPDGPWTAIVTTSGNNRW